MKKLFATLLAATMVAGTSISAFAWRDGDNTQASTGDDFTLSTKAYDKNGEEVGPGDTISGDAKLYYPILVDGDAMENKGGAQTGVYYFANYASEIDDLRVSLDDVRGGRYIDEAKIVRKEIKELKSVSFVGEDTAKNVSITADKAGVSVKIVVAAPSTVDASDNVAVGSWTDDVLTYTITPGKAKANPEQIDLSAVVVTGDVPADAKVTVPTNYSFDGTQADATGITVTTALKESPVDSKIYCVEVSINDYFGTQETELEFDLKLRTRSTQYDTEDATNAPPTYFNLGDDAEDSLVSGVDINFGGNKDTGVKFRHGELTLEINEDTGAIDLSEAKPAGGDLEDVERIYLEGDNFTYEVKASDEGEKFLKVTTDANKNIVIDNERASLDFLNFEGEPDFDFTGTLKYTVEDPDIKYYFYEIVDGKPVETNAKYNSEDECFELRTRTLGSYVVSDKVLDVEEEKEEETTTEKPADKPSTEKPVEPTTPSKPSTPNKTVPTGAIA